MGDAGSCLASDRERGAKEKNDVIAQMAAESEHAVVMSSAGISPRATPRLGPGSPTATSTKGDDDLNQIPTPRMFGLTQREEDEVDRALSAGCAARLAADELAEAREAAARAERRSKAREALAEAMASREEEALRTAVSMADSAALDAREMEGALAIIEELEACTEDDGASRLRAQAVAGLERAIRSRGHKELEAAIAEAEGIGLGVKSQRALLAEARVTLRMVDARRSAAKARRGREEALEVAAS